MWREPSRVGIHLLSVGGSNPLGALINTLRLVSHTFPSPGGLLNSRLAYSAFNTLLLYWMSRRHSDFTRPKQKLLVSIPLTPNCFFPSVLSFGGWCHPAALFKLQERGSCPLLSSPSPSVSIPLPRLRACTSDLHPLPYPGLLTGGATISSCLGYAWVLPTVSSSFHPCFPLSEGKVFFRCLECPC